MPDDERSSEPASNSERAGSPYRAPERDRETPPEDERRPADEGDTADELPADVVEEAERLTCLARRAADDAEATAYREERAELLAAHDFAARLREDDDGDVLVCHPAEWLVDEQVGDGGDAAAAEAAASGGAVDPEYIDDVDRAVEVHLEGSDDPEDWDAVYEGNHDVAAAVRDAHGDVHGENAAELAEYASNHYAKPLEALTPAELRQFREEYYTRNVWPTDEQAAALDRSLELVYEELTVPLPEE